MDEVAIVTSGAEFASQERLEGLALLEALLREKDVQPIRSVDELACDRIFDTDEELPDSMAARLVGYRPCITFVTLGDLAEWIELIDY